MGVSRQKPACPSEASLMTPASRIASTRSGVRFGDYASKWSAGHSSRMLGRDPRLPQRIDFKAVTCQYPDALFSGGKGCPRTLGFWYDFAELTHFRLRNPKTGCLPGRSTFLRGSVRSRLLRIADGWDPPRPPVRTQDYPSGRPCYPSWPLSRADRRSRTKWRHSRGKVARSTPTHFMTCEHGWHA
jgi:hypothetical protein